MDIIQNYGPSPYPGPPESKDEATRLILSLFFVGVASAVGGIVLQSLGLLGNPRHWEYLVITFAGLAYTSAMVLAALWVSTLTERARLSIRRTWALALIQSATIFVMIALLP